MYFEYIDWYHGVYFTKNSFKKIFGGKLKWKTP